MIAYDKLSTIIPSDLALANKALSAALGQISGVSNMELPTLANTVKAVNTNYGLPAINSQKQPLSTANKVYLLSTVGKGTGTCGSITVMDEIGTVAGWVVAGNLSSTTSTLSTMSVGGLAGLYTECLNCMNGAYTIKYLNPDYPTDPIEYLYKVILPHGGTFDNHYTTAAAAQNAAITGGCIPAQQAAIAGLAGAYSAQVAKMNTYFNNICQQMGNEQDLQKRAGLNFADNFANLQANSQSAIISFTQSLPSYGLDIQVQGKAQFLEAIANTSTEGGQAVVASMRQGRTQTALNEAGVLSSADVPLIPNPPPQQATLLPDTYTVQQAVAQIKF